MKRSFKILSLVLLMGVGTSSYAYTLTDTVSVKPNRALFVSIQNASTLPLHVLFSSGTDFDIDKSEGKLIGCAAIAGVTMFVSDEAQSNKITSPLECGHIYTIGEANK